MGLPRGGHLARSPEERPAMWKKGLAYRLTVSRVVSIADVAGRDRLQILFDNHPVRSVRSVDLYILCTGNQPVTAQDFAIPLSLELGKNARALTHPEVSS